MANPRHAALRGMGVELEHRLLQAEEGLAYLLAKPALDAGAKATVVQAVGFDLIDVCMAHGYHSMDLMVLHSDTPELEVLQAHCARPHTHTGDEVRYVLDGAGVYGFFDAAGAVHTVHVGPGDYLRIPAGIEHRFTLTSARRIKALRLFSDTAGWAKQYTAHTASPMAMAACA